MIRSTSLFKKFESDVSNFTRSIFLSYALGVPFLLLGVLAGSRIDRRLNNERFRILVIVMILATGVLLLV